jgi:hypothetical protein
MPTDSEIRWPPEFANAAVKVSNEITIKNVSPEVIWAWLIRAECWPKWYPNSSDVRIISPSGPDLREGTRFRWKTFGLYMTSEVQEFVPGERLAWNARGLGTWAYHAWLIQEVKGGCHVLTEENQFGFLCKLQKRFLPTRMHDKHQIWLEQLQEMARGGPDSLMLKCAGAN